MKNVKIVADSINWTESRLTSVVFSIPTCLLAELRTHRLLFWSEDSEFSVNANSDRAIPIKTKIEMVKNDTYLPIASLTKKGMTAIENISLEQQAEANEKWLKGMELMVDLASELTDMGYSKQYVNRLLMPFSWSEVIVTGDQRAWESFFTLRTKDDVEPNFRIIAKEIERLYRLSIPTHKQIGQYHIAFEEDTKAYDNTDYLDSLMISGSCCARISYGIEREETLQKHKDRFTKCVLSGHSSIAEHQARVPSKSEFAGMERFAFRRSNIYGWLLLRKLIEVKDLVITGDKLIENRYNSQFDPDMIEQNFFNPGEKTSSCNKLTLLTTKVKNVLDTLLYCQRDLKYDEYADEIILKYKDAALLADSFRDLMSLQGHTIENPIKIKIVE